MSSCSLVQYIIHYTVYEPSYSVPCSTVNTAHPHRSSTGVGMAAGGEIEQERADVSHYLEDMEILADVMEAQGHWRKPQVLESHIALHGRPQSI